MIKKGRLIPIKKRVFDTRLGPIYRTYYINPNKLSPKKGHPHPTKQKEEKLDLYKYAQKLAFCNW